MQEHLQNQGITERIHRNTGHVPKITISNETQNENDQNEKIISYFTFRRLWQETIPHLKFQSPTSDLCEMCETFKAKLLVAKFKKDEYDQIKV
ncbi:19032_t:CDS:2 [Racocetra persica]|uniref:19032_t:CDS:1 n=1 Tax=Racocetra persica TaxID=160502 RepID=A0ACA9KP57_9GLOM|nr:19032_t:CDS:2 [Racocetra persica]